MGDKKKPGASWIQRRYNIPQYQIPSLQRFNLYPAFWNTSQPGFSQGFQSRYRNNQYTYQYNPYNEIIPKINQLSRSITRSNTVHYKISNGKSEKPTRKWTTNFQKQFASNENLNQRSGNWNNRIQDIPNWLKQGAQSHNAIVNENLIQLNYYKCKTPGHFKRECSYLSHN